MWRYARLLVATNMKASIALRGAFWMRVVFMMLNNLIFFVMWWVFFDRFEQVRGWRVEDMAALYGIGAGAFGLAVVVGSGARDMARTISEGDLDCFLTQPKSPLLQTVASRSEAAGWGDLVTAFILLGISGYLSWANLPLAMLAIVCGAVVFLASMVVVQSVAFWAGDVGGTARQITDFLIMFSVSPRTIYSGYLRVLLFTVIPAGFTTFLPVELVRDFRWTVLFAVVGGAVAYAWLAMFVFARGLKRYESGNRFGVRA